MLQIYYCPLYPERIFFYYLYTLHNEHVTLDDSSYLSHLEKKRNKCLLIIRYTILFIVTDEKKGIKFIYLFIFYFVISLFWIVKNIFLHLICMKHPIYPG